MGKSPCLLLRFLAPNFAIFQDGKIMSHRKKLQELESKIQEIATEAAATFTLHQLAKLYAANEVALNVYRDDLIQALATISDLMAILNGEIQKSSKVTLSDKEKTQAVLELMKAVGEAAKMGFEQQTHFASLRGRRSVEIRHNKPNGTRDKQKQIRDAWASGKFKTRDICAEQECEDIGMSFSTARRALRNTPNPTLG